MNGNRTCMKCGQPLREGANFCTICGTAATGTQPSGSRICMRCGQPLREDASFCSICGTAATGVQQDALSSLIKLIGDALDSLGEKVADAVKRIEGMDRGIGSWDERGIAPGGMVQGPQTVTFQTKEQCEQWKARMRPYVEIIAETETYTVTYQAMPTTLTPPASTPSAVSATPHSVQQKPRRDVTEALQVLTELKVEGLLTEEEFESKKKLLNGRRSQDDFATNAAAGFVTNKI